MPDNPWTALFDVAAHQWGVIARTQARQRGIDDRTFTRRVRSERWQQPHRGVYVVPGATWGPLLRVSAALLAVDPHAAATGLTALHVHGIIDRQPPRLTLVVPHGRRARHLHGVDIVRSRTLRADDVTIARGLRCTTPPRAFLDAAPVTVDDADLRAMLIDARQRGVAEPRDVAARAAMSAPTLPGRRRLLEAVAAVTEVGADSVLSDLVHRRLVAEGLQPDPTPASVAVDGRRLHPDITFASARVCVECDSLAYHTDQRALDLDHRKDQAYSAARWRCLRVGWRRYDRDWPGFVAALRHALDEWPRVCAALGR